MDSHIRSMCSIAGTASRLASPVPLENQHRSPATSSHSTRPKTVKELTARACRCLRHYPALKVVETTMNDGGSGGAFNRLFRFITGGNDAGKKIAMTTPVFMAGGESTMAFAMPADLWKVPQPTDGSVMVREMPAGRFAVLRFSGARSPQQETEHLERLNAWTAAQGLMASADPVYAYFDPPWTPPFLRRNEVMLRIDQ